jgi:murein DD-endopeptidase MepM/ murein hydrolase activator NlpD
MKSSISAKKLFVIAMVLGHSMWIALLSGNLSTLLAQSSSSHVLHQVEPGDTWQALAWQYGLSEDVVRSANPHFNTQGEPSIGTEIVVPVDDHQIRNRGLLIRTGSAGFLEIGSLHNSNPWQIALLNEFPSPYSPLLNQQIFLPNSETLPRELPMGFQSFELAALPVLPGQVIVFRAQMNRPVSVTVSLSDVRFVVQETEEKVVGIAGTGAFFPTGKHDLTVEVEGFPSWVQPIDIKPGEWTYEQINLTGSAAAIDQASIREEWERLSAVWSKVTPEIRWQGLFRLPIDNYLGFSSLYGAHRSYNGGPYSSYHEGLDFSAYGGTPVLAPAQGTVSLAELLYVRGGAVIIDHGYGIFSGLYHMSEVLVSPGQHVEKGQVIGSVGSTGLSTGNHLHWDFLVGGTQVDPLSWLDKDIGCWLLEGVGAACN